MEDEDKNRVQYGKPTFRWIRGLLASVGHAPIYELPASGRQYSGTRQQIEIMGKVKYLLLLTILFYSCTNSTQKNRIAELEEENRIALMTIDSLKQIDAFKFNDILLKETGTPDDTILIPEYEALMDAQTEFWMNLAKNRISTIKVRSARHNTERKLFGTWEWTATDGGWGEGLETPLTTNVTRKIIINEDYTIQYFRNGVETGRDSFYITTLRENPLSKGYHTIINLINQNKAEGFRITETGNDATLTFYTPWVWGMDFPSEVFRKVTKQALQASGESSAGRPPKNENN